MLAFNANQLVGGEEEDKDNAKNNEAAANQGVLMSSDAP